MGLLKLSVSNLPNIASYLDPQGPIIVAIEPRGMSCLFQSMGQSFEGTILPDNMHIHIRAVLTTFGKLSRTATLCEIPYL